MQPDNIDDLFRQQLGGHATPPGGELQNRLDALAADERLDALFRAELAAHTTPPHRALWERLEDEHLHPQPRRRRVAAWWQYSAAAVLVLLLAGGLLWRGQPGGSNGAITARSTSPKHPAPAVAARPRNPRQPAGASLQSTDQQLALANSTVVAQKNQGNFSARATPASPLPSSPPIASTSLPRRAATTPRLAGQLPTQGSPPDAAASPLARAGGRNTPGRQPTHPSQLAAAIPVAPATPRTEPAALALATAAATPEIIEVEVRRGPAASFSPTPQPAVVAATGAGPARRPRLRLGGLLRQADHLVHGESVSLAEATGLPETVTLQAHLGSRTLSRTIQL